MWMTEHHTGYCTNATRPTEMRFVLPILNWTVYMHLGCITFPDKTFNLHTHPLQSSYRQLQQATVSQVFCLKKKKKSVFHDVGLQLRVYLLRFSSRISAPLLFLMLLSSDLMDSKAVFTSAATDLSQLFRRLHTKQHLSEIHSCHKKGLISNMRQKILSGCYHAHFRGWKLSSEGAPPSLQSLVPIYSCQFRSAYLWYLIVLNLIRK